MAIAASGAAAPTTQNTPANAAQSAAAAAPSGAAAAPAGGGQQQQRAAGTEPHQPAAAVAVAQPAQTPTPATAAAAPAPAADHARAATTTTGSADYALEMMDIGRQGNIPQDEVVTAIRGNETLDAFRGRALARLAGRSANNETRTGNGSMTPATETGTDDGFDFSGSIVVGQDRTTLLRSQAMTEALVHRIQSSRRMPAIMSPAQAEWATRMGRQDEIVRSWSIMDGRVQPTIERARAYLGRSIVEIAAECLGFRGHVRTPNQAYEVISRAFLTTSDFPNIMNNTLHKVLLNRYVLQMPTYREIAVERRFVDFREHNMIRAGEFPILEPLTEAGEIRAGAAPDSKETARVTPYGKYFPITRQVIVNDDMGAIDDLLGTAGNMVMQFENIEFYKMFNSNPRLKSDNTPVFDAAHHNLSVSGTEPGIASLSLGRGAMRKQTTLGGYPINVPASIILTGGAHETKAEQLTAAFTANVLGAINPFAGRLRTVVEGLIAGNEWYLFASPQAAPNFVYGYLQGATGPRTTTDEPFTVQGIRVKIEHDFGVGAIDYRGGFKNIGAVPTEALYTINTVDVTPP